MGGLFSGFRRAACNPRPVCQPQKVRQKVCFPKLRRTASHYSTATTPTPVRKTANKKPYDSAYNEHAAIKRDAQGRLVVSIQSNSENAASVSWKTGEKTVSTTEIRGPLGGLRRRNGIFTRQVRRSYTTPAATHSWNLTSNLVKFDHQSLHFRAAKSGTVSDTKNIAITLDSGVEHCAIKIGDREYVIGKEQIAAANSREQLLSAGGEGAKVNASSLSAVPQPRVASKPAASLPSSTTTPRTAAKPKPIVSVVEGVEAELTIPPPPKLIFDDVSTKATPLLPSDSQTSVSKSALVRTEPSVPVKPSTPTSNVTSPVEVSATTLPPAAVLPPPEPGPTLPHSAGGEAENEAAVEVPKDEEEVVAPTATVTQPSSEPVLSPREESLATSRAAIQEICEGVLDFLDDEVESRSEMKALVEGHHTVFVHLDKNDPETVQVEYRDAAKKWHREEMKGPISRPSTQRQLLALNRLTKEAGIQPDEDLSQLIVPQLIERDDGSKAFVSYFNGGVAITYDVDRLKGSQYEEDKVRARLIERGSAKAESDRARYGYYGVATNIPDPTQGDGHTYLLNPKGVMVSETSSSYWEHLPILENTKTEKQKADWKYSRTSANFSEQ